MAKLTPKEFSLDTFNGNGEEYTIKDKPTVEDFNALAQGLAYLTEKFQNG